MSDQLVKTISDHLSTWKISYFTFATLFYVMTVLVIGIPAVIAADLLPGDAWKRGAAGLAALAAAISAWARLDVVSTNFDIARINLNLAYIEYGIDKDDKKMIAALKAAEAVAGTPRPGMPTKGR